MMDRLVADVRAGQSRALVLRGDAGVGKTALLDYLLQGASGCQVAKVAGVESEMELAFAGVHQLCAGMLDRLDALPDPQRDALATAFGLAAGKPPDRFLVGLAVLGLLAEVAETKPLVYIVDDAQWLDRESVQTLAFVARRLLAERIALVFALRGADDHHALSGLPELVVDGLNHADARVLLESTIPGRLDDRVRDRILAEARGNPLALLELPRGQPPAAMAGGFGLPSALPLAARIEQGFLGRIARFRSRRDGSCSRPRPRPSRWGTWRCCGAPPIGSRSGPARWRLPRARASSSSARGCGSGIHWCGPPCTGRPRPSRSGVCTASLRR